MVRKFDMFGETWGSSNFHPAGLEAILNTEVHFLLLSILNAHAGKVLRGSSPRKSRIVPGKGKIIHY